MIGDGWPSLSRGRSALLLLALLGLVYLFMQTRAMPTEISGWRGNPFSNSAGAGLQVEARAIIGEAVPQTGRGQPGDDIPVGNPLGLPNTILTQGYGVGSHAPAAVWGGVDLALDGDGDGEADAEGTWDMPVYATHAGVARLHPDSWPGGNYLAIEAEHYKTAFAHLKAYAVSEGHRVRTRPDHWLRRLDRPGKRAAPPLRGLAGWRQCRSARFWRPRWDTLARPTALTAKIAPSHHLCYTTPNAASTINGDEQALGSRAEKPAVCTFQRLRCRHPGRFFCQQSTSSLGD